MTSFRKYLTEIAVDPEFVNTISAPTPGIRSSANIAPNTNNFNIIPIKLSYAIYDVFKRYVTPKFRLADELLNRRGSSVSIVEVKASNEELINLKELAEFIVANAPKSTNRPNYTNEEREVAVAKLAIQEIESKMHGIGA